MTKRIISIISLVVILAVCLMSTTSCLLIWEGLKELENQGNETPENPGEGGETPENPGEGGETPENPGEGGETPENPGEGGETPENPGEGGETPENPGEGGETPENPGEGGETPENPGEGGEQPPHEHSFVDGKCECGADDPDYVPPHVNKLVVGETNEIYVDGSVVNAWSQPIVWVEFVVAEKANYRFACAETGALALIYASDYTTNLCAYTGAADLEAGTYYVCVGGGAVGMFNVTVTRTEIVTEEPGEGGEVTPPAHVNTLVVGDTNKIVVSGEVANSAGLPIEWVAFTADEKAHYEFVGDTNAVCLIFDTNYTLICGGTGKADLEAGSYLICVGNGVVGEFNVAVTKSAIPPAEVKPIVNVSDLALGTTTDAELIAGTGIYASAGLTIEENSKTLGEETFAKRLKTGGGMKVDGGVVKAAIRVDTTGAAKIIVYCMSSSGTEERVIQLATLSDGAFVVLDSIEGVGGAALAKYELYVTEAGTYYFGSASSGLNIYYIAVESHEHNYKSVVTAPTCTAAGYTTYTCDCGKSYTADETASLGHTDGDAVEENKVDSTCSATGSYDSVVYCSVCSVEVSRETKPIDKKAHTEAIDAAVAATCTTAGKTEGKHCSVCEEVLVAQTEVAAPGHTEVIDAGTAADCDSTGLSEGKHCSVCKEVLVAQTTTPALGHTDKNNNYICDVCEAKLCTDHTEETIPAVAATCEATGLSEGKKCSTCGEILLAQETVAALGHTDAVDAAVAPDCENTGLTEGKHCSVCKEVLVAQTTIPALGHTDAEAVVENKVDATCKAAGSYDSVVYCSVCSVEVSRETKPIDKKAHTEAIDAAVAATCTTAGKTEGKHCSVCEEVLVAQTEVAALGHSYNDGKCAGCGDETADYNPLVMNFSNFKEYAKNTYAAGDLQVYNDYFTFIHNVDSRIDSSNKSFADGFKATLRFNFGGSTSTGETPTKSALKITTTGAMTLKLWWVSGGNDRLPILLDENGAQLLAAEASVKDSLYITEFALPAAGTYYLGNTSNNYWFKVELSEGIKTPEEPGTGEGGEEGGETPEEPGTGEGGETPPAATKEVFKYETAGDSISKNTVIYPGDAFSVKWLEKSATITATTATAEDGTEFTACLLPSGSGGGCEITANKSGKITLYVTVTDGSFASKTATVTYGDKSIEIQSAKGVAYILELDVEAGQTYTVKASANRLAIFGVVFE